MRIGIATLSHETNTFAVERNDTMACVHLRRGPELLSGVHPKSFVGGGESGFDSVAERARQAGWGVFPVDSGHDTMITHAPELTEILLKIGSQ